MNDRFGNFTNMGAVDSVDFEISQQDAEKISKASSSFQNKYAQMIQNGLDMVGIKIPASVFISVFGLMGAYQIVKLLKGNLLKIGGVLGIMYIYKNQDSLRGKIDKAQKMAKQVKQLSNTQILSNNPPLAETLPPPMV